MTGEERIKAERHRQVWEEGWSEDGDDTYTRGELARAAKCYADEEASSSHIPAEWPWDSSYWKPTTRERNLEKAGALWLAEASRRERASSSDGEVQSAYTKAWLIAEELDEL